MVPSWKGGDLLLCERLQLYDSYYWRGVSVFTVCWSNSCIGYSCWQWPLSPSFLLEVSMKWHYFDKKQGWSLDNKHTYRQLPASVLNTCDCINFLQVRTKFSYSQYQTKFKKRQIMVLLFAACSRLLHWVYRIWTTMSHSAVAISHCSNVQSWVIDDSIWACRGNVGAVQVACSACNYLLVHLLAACQNLLHSNSHKLCMSPTPFSQIG